MSATIFALSTPRGRGGLAVVRMSGGEAADILRGLIGELPAPRRASLRSLIDPAHDDLIDQAVVLYFPAPNSATGEDVVEFHLHGGNAVTSALLEFLGRQLGCRMAKPGEFTRRAFENGKLDLTGAEGLADLIEADTAQQRRQALRQLGGDLARLTEDWAHRLMRQMAYLEAVIDFPDEDLPSHLLDPMLSELERLAAEMHQQLDDGRRGEILRDGVHVAIIGPPNSGKSSLLNALAGRDAAIVSHVAGTTRDVVEVRLALDGFPVILADTAGLRESADPIEAEGMRRALARAEAADITVLVLDASLPESLEGFREQAGPDGIVVWNKCDLPDARPRAAEGLLLSVRTGNGLKNLTTALAKRAEAAAGGPPAVVTRLRHREAIAECAEALERVFHVKHADFDAELVAEDLRMALRALGRLTGRIDVEDLLDIVFRDFCIGK